MAAQKVLPRLSHGSYEHEVSVSIVRMALHCLEVPEGHPLSETCWTNAVMRAARESDSYDECENDFAVASMMMGHNAVPFTCEADNG